MCGKNERGYVPEVVATAWGRGHTAGEPSCFFRPPVGAAPKKLLGSLTWGHPWSCLWEGLSLARLHPVGEKNGGQELGYGERYVCVCTQQHD